ncbi:unnamed protein product [Didymodactylos carnosus]|uniref:Uncharacterized protein n=1 Tax=Didymodactylos carnosus TaxID=1234261 RepID=A0A814TS68_9BILA|nr:unnamed protein product [Didymodactylos carnosus]CAF3928296.1 unnamed protein product [Didymodactylos carnosus]
MGLSQRASADAEENNSHDDRSAMERSDDETDAPIRAYRERRAMNETSSVLHHFDRVDEEQKNTASTPILMSIDPEESESEDDVKSELDRLDIPADIEDDQEDQTTDESSESDGSPDDEHDCDEECEAQEIFTDESIEDFLSSNTSMENTRIWIQKLVKRVRSCVNYIRNNCAINDYVCNRAGSNLPPIRAGLVIDFEVRWNSTYIMLDRFIIHRAILNEITTEPLKIPVEFALSGFLNTETIGDSTFMKCLKACVSEKFEHYFVHEMGKSQKDASLFILSSRPVTYISELQ